jgi:hypothetical protein
MISYLSYAYLRIKDSYLQNHITLHIASSVQCMELKTNSL